MRFAEEMVEQGEAGTIKWEPDEVWEEYPSPPDSFLHTITDLAAALRHRGRIGVGTSDGRLKVDRLDGSASSAVLVSDW